MDVSFYFKNLDPSEAIRNYVSEKLERLDKRFHHVEGCDARFEVERQNQIFELTIHADSTVFHIKKSEKDLYAAIDSSLSALNKQVDRYHKKIDSRNDPIPLPPAELDSDVYDDAILIHSAPAKPMDDHEAILQLRAHKFKFLMYHSSTESRYNLLMTRADGNYSVIKSTEEPGNYEEHVFRVEQDKLEKVSVTLYPLMRITVLAAVERLKESSLDFFTFVNEESGRMNLLFQSKHEELILQRPA